VNLSFTLRPQGVIDDTSYPSNSEYLLEDQPFWKDFYPDSEGKLPHDLSMSKGPKVRMTM
jgi:hypothetical protein